MSMIEKEAKKYKKKASQRNSGENRNNDPAEIDKEKSEVSLSSSDDKTHIVESLDIAIDDNKSVDIDLSFYQEEDAESIEDQTLFPEEDITDISGFDGFSVKAKKSKHSNNIHIDLNKLNDDGFLTPKHPDSALSSVFRMIKRHILDNARGKGASVVDHPNLIQVTSSFANEGKTYSAINLAISIAMEQDLNVLLIDADIRKPSLAKSFDMEEGKGLTDYLSGDVKDMKSILYNTNIPSLTLMCAGSPHPNGTELLSSTSMHQFINEISTRYPNRIIIFDSPPLLQTTESSTLASHMGQVILVVEAETTLAPQINKSIEILQNEIVLLLLNKQREKKNDIAYGYGYGY